jgi:hypothetical protein
MKQFRVFRHPVRGFEAVKVGVSWPAGFFSVFWLLAKKLWGWAGFWLGVAVVLSFVEQAADSASETGAKVLLYLIDATGWLVTGLIPWLKGNTWRESNLRARGYEFVAVTEAQTPDAAISQVASRLG